MNSASSEAGFLDLRVPVHRICFQFHGRVNAKTGEIIESGINLWSTAWRKAKTNVEERENLNCFMTM
ncbi:CFC_HP_G0025090.mRNA.1.CDS.1 [Saccharomyces cerevisiae]|nr:CFC_HP_G0025090.mRNA.1.CDS.1 [Saccharomyces cerevisiae]CAI6944616.1 CFC_HP_G0025090.mRNA.1.CDS.1 [Saccharomyces cerevisiae]